MLGTANDKGLIEIAATMLNRLLPPEPAEPTVQLEVLCPLEYLHLSRLRSNT